MTTIQGKRFNWKIADPLENTSMPGWVMRYLHDCGVTETDAQLRFLEPRYDALPSPYAFAHMEKAVTRVSDAIERKEKIGVFGDYDCDGVCSSAIVTDVLSEAGTLPPLLRLPHREREGYGLNINAVNEFHSAGVTLIITTDCGSSNVQEIAYARDLGIEVIVIDHHQRPTELPDAFAILNSAFPEETFPDKTLCATGVAWFFAQALLEKRKNTYSPKWYLDLVAIATIGDIMPLTGVNRLLVNYGLRVIHTGRRVGVKALAEVSRIDYKYADAGDIGFGLVPRINAAGRMEHAHEASVLIRATDGDEARRLAQRLHMVNRERQEGTKEYVALAQEQLSVQKKSHGRVIVGEAWPHGLLGLIAGRICEQEHVPVFVLSRLEHGYIASGRAPKHVNIMEFFDTASPLLSKYGGHPQACGFSLKPETDISTFQHAAAYWFSTLPTPPLAPDLPVCGYLTTKEIAEAWEWREKLKPFGHKVREPIFVLGPFLLLEVRPLGTTQSHAAMTVGDDTGRRWRGVYFNAGKGFIESVREVNTITLATELSMNRWKGKETIEFRIRDWKVG